MKRRHAVRSLPFVLAVALPVWAGEEAPKMSPEEQAMFDDAANFFPGGALGGNPKDGVMLGSDGLLHGVSRSGIADAEGGKAFSISPDGASFSLLASLDPARDLLLDLLASALNAELGPRWTAASKPCSTICARRSAASNPRRKAPPEIPPGTQPLHAHVRLNDET